MAWNSERSNFDQIYNKKWSRRYFQYYFSASCTPGRWFMCSFLNKSQKLAILYIIFRSYHQELKVKYKFFNLKKAVPYILTIIYK